MTDADRIAKLEALLLAFRNEAAVSGLTKEMEVRKPFLKLDRGMRELGLLK